MKLKRIFAYLIDIILVGLIASIIFTLPMFNKDMEMNREASEEFIELIQSNGSGLVDTEQFDNIAYKLNYSSRITNIVEIALYLIYFGIIQFATGGKTIGKKLMGIKVEPEKGKELSAGFMFLRAVILHNIIFKIISTTVFITCKQGTAMTINSYTNYCSLIMTIIIIGTIIFRDDERGLHDLICRTKVINTKKEK